MNVPAHSLCLVSAMKRSLYFMVVEASGSGRGLIVMRHRQIPVPSTCVEWLSRKHDRASCSPTVGFGDKGRIVM